MTFNALALQTTITSTITSLGEATTISRNGTLLFSTTAVFAGQKNTGEDKTPIISQVGTAIVGSLVCYIPGNVSPLPIVNDDVARASGGTFNIATIEPYNPNGTVIAYKLVLE